MNIHDKYKPLTFWEKLYLPAIIAGIWLTSKHFFRNLTLHILRALRIRKNAMGSVTIQYPEFLRPLFPRPAKHFINRRNKEIVTVAAFFQESLFFRNKWGFFDFGHESSPSLVTQDVILST